MAPALERTDCPICECRDFAPTAGAADDPRLEGGRSTWAICKNCGLVLQNPRPTTEELDQLYDGHVYHGSSDDRLPETLAYALRRPLPLIKFINAHLPANNGTHRAMLDVGCGLGGAVLTFKARGWEAHGVEPDPQLAAFAQEHGLDVRAEFFTTESFPELAVDLVYTCHAFEHFPDPLAIALAAWEKLRPGGFLFVCVPTFRHARMWARGWQNAAHTFIFTDRTLGNLLYRAGFAVVAHQYNAAEGELWLMATKQTKPTEIGPLPYREEWQSVRRELAMTVPLRAAAWWVPRHLASNAHHLPVLLLDPREFARGVGRRLHRRHPASPTEADGGLD